LIDALVWRINLISMLLAGFNAIEYDFFIIWKWLTFVPPTLWLHCMHGYAGKSTLVDRLAVKLSASRLRSPPEEIRHLRAVFDAKPTVVRRAYYYLGNYLLARRVREFTRHQTVVLDRLENRENVKLTFRKGRSVCVVLRSGDLNPRRPFQQQAMHKTMQGFVVLANEWSNALFVYNYITCQVADVDRWHACDEWFGVRLSSNV